MKATIEVKALVEAVRLPDGLGFYDFGDRALVAPVSNGGTWIESLVIAIERKSDGAKSIIECSPTSLGLAEIAERIDASIAALEIKAVA